MRTKPFLRGRIWLPWLVLLLTAAAPAQFIEVKTVPLASGGQFLLFPSQNLGMGGVSIALEDPLLDPFTNPARGSQIDGVRLFSAPAFYSISGELGAGRTLPLGALFGSGRWFGGISLAAQQLQAADKPEFFGPVPTYVSNPSQIPSYQYPDAERNANNLYFSGSLGTRIAGSGLAVAASFFYAGLEAVEGVEVLYPNSLRVEQSGRVAEARLGLLAELGERRSIEGVLLYHHADMTQDVFYPATYWWGGPEPFIEPGRVERNLDRTGTWGAHLQYRQPLPGEQWQAGGILTANLKTHPKIPNYELMNIPRDPGDSRALNIGAGVSRRNGPAVFGVDLVYEPIWSHTWADAAAPVETPSGSIIPAGGKTVDNRFRFSNWLLRIGVERQDEPFGFQIGLQWRWIRYWLEQENYLGESRRSLRTGWSEWSPGVGLSLKFPEFQIRYTGRLTLGTGRPGVAGVQLASPNGNLMGSDLLIAPNGEVAVDEAIVLTHQFSVIIPLRTK